MGLCDTLFTVSLTRRAEFTIRISIKTQVFLLCDMKSANPDNIALGLSIN
jgi:hypothetical protein